MASIYPISNVTVGSGGSAAMEWTSIPDTYNDLLLVLSVRSSYPAAYAGHRFRVNGDTTSNYAEQGLYGDGAAVYAYSYTAQTFITLGLTADTATSNTFSVAKIYIPNYAKTTNKKFMYWDYTGEDNATTVYQYCLAPVWQSTAAITSLKVDMGSYLAKQYSSGTLYGIK